MALWIKALATTPGDLSTIPRTHVAGENWPLQVIL